MYILTYMYICTQILFSISTSLLTRPHHLSLPNAHKHTHTHIPQETHSPPSKQRRSTLSTIVWLFTSCVVLLVICQHLTRTLLGGAGTKGLGFGGWSGGGIGGVSEVIACARNCASNGRGGGRRGGEAPQPGSSTLIYQQVFFYSPPPPWKGGVRGEGSERMLKGSISLWNLPLHFFFLSFCPSRSRSRSRSHSRSRSRSRSCSDSTLRILCW